MSRNTDSVSHTVKVALILCVVCSVIVSGAAVILKPRQVANKELDRNRNILVAAGLYREGEHSRDDVAELFSQFEVRAVNLDAGRFATDSELADAGISLASYDQRKAAKTPELSMALTKAEDIAGIGRRARFALVYIVKENANIAKLVLPVHGYGLWGTLYGYLALEGDGQTVLGLGFYDHKETPGLGAEVDNPKWKAQWPGKQIYGSDRQVAVSVAKRRPEEGSAAARHHVDALSGATLTSRGVQNLLSYWLGEEGFGPFLAKLQGGQA